jgi:signal transduction histidine kinase
LVECYAGQVNQVLMNLLSNAIGALEEHPDPEKPPTIRIQTEVLDQRVTIRIMDNGMGIPESVQTHLFKPFFTTKPVGKGTGLGLSISYQIITEKHGGSLKCISTPGKGAEFVVEIPIKQLS